MKLEVFYDNGSAVTLREQPASQPAPVVPLYMHREDKEVFGRIRDCAPCPAVMVLKEDSHVFMSQQWQYFLRAANYNMTLENVRLTLDTALAFANETGFRDTEPRQDWFWNRNLTAQKPPQLDKVRTCSRNAVTGTEFYRLQQAFFEVVKTAKIVLYDARQSAGSGIVLKSAIVRRLFMDALTAPNTLKVWTFDSRQLPPLKPGRSYPTDISRVNPDDYLYMPERDREKFLVANIVNARGEVVQFPRGALYPWFEGGRTIATFLPHISNHGYGSVDVPLRNFVRVHSVPSPYRLF